MTILFYAITGAVAGAFDKKKGCEMFISFGDEILKLPAKESSLVIRSMFVENM